MLRAKYTVFSDPRSFLKAYSHSPVQATTGVDVRRYLNAATEENAKRANRSVFPMDADDTEWLRNGLIRRPIF